MNIIRWISIIPLLIGLAMLLKTVVFDVIIWKSLTPEDKKGWVWRFIFSVVAVCLGAFVYLMIGKGLV